MATYDYDYNDPEYDGPMPGEEEYDEWKQEAALEGIKEKYIEILDAIADDDASYLASAIRDIERGFEYEAQVLISPQSWSHPDEYGEAMVDVDGTDPKVFVTGSGSERDMDLTDIEIPSDMKKLMPEASNGAIMAAISRVGGPAFRCLNYLLVNYEKILDRDDKENIKATIEEYVKDKDYKAYSKLNSMFGDQSDIARQKLIDNDRQWILSVIIPFLTALRRKDFGVVERQYNKIMALNKDVVDVRKMYLPKTKQPLLTALSKPEFADFVPLVERSIGFGIDTRLQKSVYDLDIPTIMKIYLSWYLESTKSNKYLTYNRLENAIKTAISDRNDPDAKLFLDYVSDSLLGHNPAVPTKYPWFAVGMNMLISVLSQPSNSAFKKLIAKILGKAGYDVSTILTNESVNNRSLTNRIIEKMNKI